MLAISGYAAGRCVRSEWHDPHRISFFAKSAWREYLVPYTVEQVRFFLLSSKSKKKNATIDSSAVLNEDQYLTVGSKKPVLLSENVPWLDAILSMDKFFQVGWAGELIVVLP